MCGQTAGWRNRLPSSCRCGLAQVPTTAALTIQQCNPPQGYSPTIHCAGALQDACCTQELFWDVQIQLLIHTCIHCIIRLPSTPTQSGLCCSLCLLQTLFHLFIQPVGGGWAALSSFACFMGLCISLLSDKPSRCIAYLLSYGQGSFMAGFNPYAFCMVLHLSYMKLTSFG